MPFYKHNSILQQSLRKIAFQSLNTMRIRRYHGPVNESRCHDDSSRDTCAVCLEEYHLKQVRNYFHRILSTLNVYDV